jgi:hypothetical protein
MTAKEFILKRQEELGYNPFIDFKRSEETLKEYTRQLCKDAWQVGFNVGCHDDTLPSYLSADDWVKDNIK